MQSSKTIIEYFEQHKITGVGEVLEAYQEVLSSNIYFVNCLCNTVVLVIYSPHIPSIPNYSDIP